MREGARGWYERIEDDRKGKTFCKDCGQEIALIKVDDTWHKRNLEDGHPHRLTCEGGA